MNEYNEISPERIDEMIEFLVDKVGKYNMYVPAIFFLETGQPLSVVFSNLMYMGAPIGGIMFEGAKSTLEDYAKIFEDRRNLNKLIDELGKKAEETRRKEREEKAKRKKKK